MRNIYALTGIVGLLFMSLSSMQDNTKVNTRLVVINFSDSSVHARVLITKSTINPNERKTYYWYTPECINTNQGGFSGYLLHGDYSVYDKKQQLVATGTFSKGLKTGTWKRWYPNGNLSEITSWKNGMLSGTAFYYDHNGKQSGQTRFKKGSEVERHVIRFRKTKKTDDVKMDSLAAPSDTNVITDQIN